MLRQIKSIGLFSTPILFLCCASIALAQGNQFHVDYTVAVADVDKQLFHVTAEIKNIKQPALNLSLPTWTPGWYTIENYAKNTLRFKITDPKGNRVQPQMTRKQTWHVDTRELSQIKVEFDYQASVLALNQAKITKDFAFFTGTELFLEVSGLRKTPSNVRFEVPQGWKIQSALKETAEPMVFMATDYDNLVDCPTEMGNFDEYKFEVEGKPHYFLATPTGIFAKEKAQKFTEMLAKAYAAESAIFGGFPYEKQICFYFFTRAESNAGGALEHSNSFVAFALQGNLATPEMLINTAAHEFFHLWNVKRIRPTEMYPYDYSRENETPLLWVSEGFTNYYAAKSLYRAGLNTRERFLQSVANAMNGVEMNEARKYISPADSSTSTWIGYDTRQAFEISYYTQGQNLGALLDLSILHDTKGAAGLDDVMRTLFRDFYKKDKGFSMEDLIQVINHLTKRDYHDFFKRYVTGVEIPPYGEIVGYAGYQLNDRAMQQKQYKIIEMPDASPEQLKIREGWLKIGA